MASSPGPPANQKTGSGDRSRPEAGTTATRSPIILPVPVARFSGTDSVPHRAATSPSMQGANCSRDAVDRPAEQA